MSCPMFHPYLQLSLMLRFKWLGRNIPHGVVPLSLHMPSAGLVRNYIFFSNQFWPQDFFFFLMYIQNIGLAVTTNWKELLRMLKLIYHPGNGMPCFTVTVYLPWWETPKGWGSNIISGDRYSWRGHFTRRTFLGASAIQYLTPSMYHVWQIVNSQ